MYDIFKNLALPPASLILLIAAGLVIARKKPKIGFSAAWLGLALLYLASIPAVSSTLVWMLEPQSGPSLEQLAQTDADAIVVLSAGMDRHRPEFGGETIDALTLERIRYAARVHRITGLPILTSGGLLPKTTIPVGLAMKFALEQDFGIDVRWSEIASRTTAENAALSAALLRQAGVHKIILVTHALHMPRSVAVFEKEGLTVMPAPTGFHGRLGNDVLYFIPRESALRDTYYASYELLGRIWYWLTGQS